MPNTSILFWNFTRLCTKGITLYVRPMHCILVCGLQYRIINKGEEWSLIVVIIVRVKTVGQWKRSSTLYPKISSAGTGHISFHVWAD